MKVIELSDKDVERFWSKVRIGAPDECWEWQAATKGGYGEFSINHHMYASHRVAFMASNTEFDQRLHVLHSCDNPPCCNPAHLFLGTNLDNVKDRDAKGRQANHAGIHHGRAKLTEEDVLTIRAEYIRGTSRTPGNTKELCTRFGIDQTTLSNIIVGKRWKHLY